MKLKNGFVIRTICNDTVAIYAGDSIVDLQNALILNDSAEFIFRFLLKETTSDEVVLELTKKYDITEEAAKQDFEQFVALLSEKGYLE